MSDLYEKDIHAWSEQQAALIRRLMADPLITASMVRDLADEMRRRSIAARQDAQTNKDAGNIYAMAYARAREVAYNEAVEAIGRFLGIDPSRLP